MSTRERLSLTANELEGTTIGRALLAGRLVATVKGRESHITVKASLKAKVDGRWREVTWDRATHCFLSVPGADGGWPDRIGTYYPQGKYEGMFFADQAADLDRCKAALYVLESAGGRKDGKHVLAAKFCFRCGRELTEPESIKLGFGPECWPHVQGEHQVKDKTNRPDKTLSEHVAEDLESRPNTQVHEIAEPLIMLSMNDKASDVLARMGE